MIFSAEPWIEANQPRWIALSVKPQAHQGSVSSVVKACGACWSI